MKESFLLSSDALPHLRLRTIDASDCELLRQWKNANRTSFFFQGVIDPDGQRRWYEDYRDRPQDFMFMVEAGGERAGCLGFRSFEGTLDVYNVIRGDVRGGAPGLMSAALRLLCSYGRASFPSPVVARVLKTNPAVPWYEKNGFGIAADHETYYLMRLDEARFTPLPFSRAEISA